MQREEVIGEIISTVSLETIPEVVRVIETAPLATEVDLTQNVGEVEEELEEFLEVPEVIEEEEVHTPITHQPLMAPVAPRFSPKKVTFATPEDSSDTEKPVRQNKTQIPDVDKEKLLGALLGIEGLEIVLKNITIGEIQIRKRT